MDNRPPVSMELRSRVRYRLSADAVFTWEGPQPIRLSGEGVTRDISVAGAFIFTRTCPPVGAILNVEIFLSPAPGSRGRAVQIKTEASVIRVDHSVGAEGFAAVSKDFTLLFDKNTKRAFGVTSVDNDDEGLAAGRERRDRPRAALHQGVGPATDTASKANRYRGTIWKIAVSDTEAPSPSSGGRRLRGWKGLTRS